MGPVRKPVALALLLSLLGHILLLSLIFGGQGLGHPGLGLPWRDRRIEASEPRVVTVSPRITAAALPAPADAEPLRLTSIDRPVAAGQAPAPEVSGVPPLRRMAQAIVPEAQPSAEAMPRVRDATPVADATAPLLDPGPVAAVPAPTPDPTVIAVERIDPPVWVVPPPSLPMPVVAAAPSASSPQTAPQPPRQAGDAAQAQVDLKARERELEVARFDRSALDAQRRAEQREEAARVEATRLEAVRQEATRQSAARQVAAQQ